MPIEPQTEALVTYIGGSGLGLYLIRHLWRMFSRDRVDGVKDTVESGWIKSLGDTNERLNAQNHQLYQERNDCFVRVRELENELNALRATVVLMQSEIAILKGTR